MFAAPLPLTLSFTTSRSSILGFLSVRIRQLCQLCTPTRHHRVACSRNHLVSPAAESVISHRRHVAGFDTRDSDIYKSNGMFKVLSIDGGGVRGIFAARFLQRCEEYGVKLSDAFDLIVGTSTGGIIALGAAYDR